jgi:hypothetical protein
MLTLEDRPALRSATHNFVHRVKGGPEPAIAIVPGRSHAVRYSRLRKSALGLRRGVTVRFTVVGDTSLRCDFAMIIRLLAHLLFV